MESGRQLEITAFVRSCHEQGMSIIEAIKQVCLQYGLPLAEAKQRVSAHASYSEAARRSETLHDEAIRIVIQSSDGQ